MLAINETIKKAYNKYTTQRKSYIKIDNNSFFVQNLDISADAYRDGNVIGNAISKIVKFDIETVNINGIDEFELFDGIWTGNQYEYISLGTFKLFNEEGTDDFFSSVVAYDKLIYFNKEYIPAQTTFPTTVLGLLQSICSQAGVELENISLPNGEQPLEENLFVENETLKNVLNAICQINGCFGIISQDKLKLLLKGTDTINLSKYQLSNPEYKRTTWNINQVVLGMSNIEGEYVKYPDDTEIQGNIHKLVINDNPFVYTQELRTAYIKNLYNQVNNFGYISFETQWEGLPFIELGDSLYIDGKESIVLRYNLKSPDGLKSTLSAPSIIDSVVEYIDNSNSIKNRQKRTEILVDKQNQKIEAVTSNISTLDTTVSNNYQELNNKFENYVPESDFVTLENSVTQLQTDTYTKTEINTKLTDGSVTKVMTTSGTFDEDGMHYEKSNAPTSSTINEKGVEVDSTTTGEELLFAGYDEEMQQTIVRTENLTVRKYLVVGDNSRIENYGNGGGIFIL